MNCQACGCATHFVECTCGCLANVEMEGFAMVRQFHEKMGIGYDGPPRHLPGDHYAAILFAKDCLRRALSHLQRPDATVAEFRIGFMFEELWEYLHAHVQRDLAAQLDALVDLEYVVLGASDLQGFPHTVARARVHAANMKKMRGPSARHGEIDVIKPDGWTPPVLADLVQPTIPTCTGCGTEGEGSLLCQSCGDPYCATCILEDELCLSCAEECETDD